MQLAVLIDLQIIMKYHMLKELFSSSQAEVDKIEEAHSIVAGVGIRILQDIISLRLMRNYLYLIMLL